ncbi:MAG: DUF2812 domain-containing protein, partial [Erysipelotrichaceae bacterium]|nr:DUF2812 domain-containing protein [Erysipelotrichaceae bacterium]
MYKNVWFFYTMFQFEKLEQWLEQMAREGWVYSGTKYLYRFEFKKSPYPVYLAYRVDYRAFQLDGYLNDLQKQGWAIYKLSKYWSVCSKGYATNKPPVLKTNYDEDTLPYLRKSRIWQIAVTILCFTAPMF